MEYWSIGILDKKTLKTKRQDLENRIYIKNRIRYPEFRIRNKELKN